MVCRLEQGRVAFSAVRAQQWAEVVGVPVGQLFADFSPVTQ